MADDSAFEAFLSDDGPDTSDDTNDAHVGLTDLTDGVRTELDREVTPVSAVGEETYESADGEKGADDVDGRKLHRNTTVDEIRYFYREGEFGGTLVDKPVDDAFTHGYRVTNDPSNAVQPFLDRYVPVLRRAEKKARRDGFAVIYFQTNDASEPYRSPTDVTGLDKLRVLTLDDFVRSEGHTIPARAYQDGYFPDGESAPFGEFYTSQLELTPNGCVVVDDPLHPDHGELLGYAVDSSNEPDTETPSFLHIDRCQHIVARPEVDGPVGTRVFGHVEGDSVLAAGITAMRAINKGNWGMGQALFRYSAPLHVAETPQSYTEDQWQQVDDQLHDLVMASSVTLPSGTELDTHDAATEFDPEPFYGVLINNLAATSMVTKSVLIGAMTGEVAGSESDTKNYLQQVDAYRRNRLTELIREAVEKMHTLDQSVIPTFSLGFTLSWEPLVRIEGVDRLEGMVRVLTAASNGVQNYMLTPDEARSLVEDELAKLDTEVSLDDLQESQMDTFDRINKAEAGRGPNDNEPVNTETGTTRGSGSGRGRPSDT